MSIQPVRSKSSLYFERYAGAERRSMALGLTVYLLGCICLFLAAGLVVLAIRPRAIHYIPPVSSAALGGVSYPDEVPDAAVLSFATAWLMNWVNYTPQTAEDVYERSLVLMSPGFQARIKAGLDEELARISREKIASVFSLKQEPKLAARLPGFRIILTGERAIYAGQEEMTREEVRFVMEVCRAAPTETDPYGLVVEDVSKERVPHEVK
jgi:hypothetical protein